MSRHVTKQIKNPINRKSAAEILKISQRTLDRYIESKRLTAYKSNSRVWLDEKEIMRLKDELINDNTINLAYQDRTQRAIAKNDPVSSSTPSNSVSTRLSTHVSTSVYSESENFQKKESVEKVMHNDRYLSDVVVETLLHIYGNEMSTLVNDEVGVENMLDNSIVQTNSFYSTLHPTISPTLNYYSEGVYRKLYEELKQQQEEMQKKVELAHYRVGQLEAQLGASVTMLEYKKVKEENHLQLNSLRNELEKRDLVLKKVRVILMTERVNKWVFAGLVFLLLAMQPLLWWFAKA